MRTFLIASAVTLALASSTMMPASGLAQQTSLTQQTIRGVLKYGTLDSSLQVSESEDYGFLTNSSNGKKILSACQMDDLCEIEATIDTTQQWIKAVRQARKVTQAGLQAGGASCQMLNLQKDMPYQAARERILKMGFTARSLPPGGYKPTDEHVISECNGNADLCNKLPEITSCGQGYCSMKFVSPNGSELQVVTYGDLEQDDASVTSFKLQCSSAQSPAEGEAMAPTNHPRGSAYPLSAECSADQVLKLAADEIMKQLKKEQALSVMRTGFINPNQGEPRVALQAIRTSADRNGQRICNARVVVTIPFKGGRPPFTFGGDVTYRAQITDAGDEVIVTLLRY